MLIQELITATFDVLSNAMYRNESTRNMFVFRSFLVNKLPPFIAGMAATSIEQIPMEMCISHALNRVDPNAFPSFSQMFEMQGNTVLSDVRQEFLFACALHRLIPEASIERLLGENPMQTLPVGGRYVKDDIITQILSNQGAADRLISEIEMMEGNAGAVVAAVTDVRLLDRYFGCYLTSPGHTFPLRTKRNGNTQEYLRFSISTPSGPRCNVIVSESQKHITASVHASRLLEVG